MLSVWTDKSNLQLSAGQPQQLLDILRTDVGKATTRVHVLL